MSENMHSPTHWNGELGERWARSSDRMDALLAPVAKALLEAAALEPGERVLDIGCGAGATTLEAMQRVGETGAAIGADVSGPLVAHARKRAQTRGSAARFELADASAWQPSEPVDVLISRFGVMFFDDPVAAFANMHAGMAAQGRMAFFCWRSPPECELIALPMQAIGPYLKEASPVPEQDAPGPFAFQDADRLTRLLKEAGWRDIEIAAQDIMLPVTGEGDLQARVRSIFDLTPLPALIKAQDIDSEKVIAALVSLLEARLNAAGDPELLAGVWRVTARA